MDKYPHITDMERSLLLKLSQEEKVSVQYFVPLLKKSWQMKTMNCGQLLLRMLAWMSIAFGCLEIITIPSCGHYF